MNKILFFGTPDALPPELAENPDVIVIDPETIDPELMQALDDASGGMLLGEGGEPPPAPEGGEGPLADWAGEEEREHGMGPEEDEEERKAAAMGRGPEDEEEDGAMGRGPEEDEEEKRKAELAAQGRGRRGGKGNPMLNWARSTLGIG